MSVHDGGGKALAHAGDLSDSEYAADLIADTVAEYGRVDAVLNFAGDADLSRTDCHF